MFVGYSYDNSRLACLILPMRFECLHHLLCAHCITKVLFEFGSQGKTAASYLLVVKPGLGFKTPFPQIFLEQT
jgi:hypothetical protein